LVDFILMIDLKRIPKTEFAAAVAQVAGERNIDVKVVIDSLGAAILAAFKRDARERGMEIDEEANYEVKLDSETGDPKVFLIGKKGKKREVTPPGFGRIAAQTAKQVVLQKIREAEKEAIISQFKARVGTLVNGVVLRVDGSKATVGISRAEAWMPREEQVRGEQYRPSQRLVFYLKEIKEIEGRKQIIVSRAAPELVIELFRREVPEVSSGAVEVKAIARSPGERTKIAVFSAQRGVDPVGSCVGQKGIRVQTVIKELANEKVDVVPYNENIKQFIASSLSPADDVTVSELDEKKKIAVVAVADDQLAMAIGDRGENVGLAGQLTGYEIKVVGKKKKKAVKKKAQNKKVK